MVLFVFVVMMLNMGKEGVGKEKQWLAPSIWIVPTVLALILLGEMVYVLLAQPDQLASQGVITAKQVGIVLFGPYLLAVEIASMLLLAGLVGAYHLARRYLEEGREES
jgi:NADH-quinone oxidoreductase subunit J